MSINNGDVERRYHDFSAYCLDAKPDIIAVQEVSADVGFSALNGLAKALGHDYGFFYECTYPGQEDTQGVGIVTRLPVRSKQIVNSGHGRNQFQVLNLEARAGRRLQIANVHLEAHLLLDFMRRRKLESLISQLDSEQAQMLTGDFNAIPHLPSIKRLKTRYDSAYASIHTREPSHTYPTDLGEHLLLHNGDANGRQILAMRLAAWVFQKPENRRPSGLPRMVTDYVFVNQLVEVTGVAVTGHDELDLAHSDHRGLEVDFAIR
jgi:endonuclease/exonuclease/phosphatase family metal-dependent hydrolase